MIYQKITFHVDEVTRVTKYVPVREVPFIEMLVTPHARFIFCRRPKVSKPKFEHLQHSALPPVSRFYRAIIWLDYLLNFTSREPRPLRHSPRASVFMCAPNYIDHRPAMNAAINEALKEYKP